MEKLDGGKGILVDANERVRRLKCTLKVGAPKGPFYIRAIVTFIKVGNPKVSVSHYMPILKG